MGYSIWSILRARTSAMPHKKIRLSKAVVAAGWDRLSAEELGGFFNKIKYVIRKIVRYCYPLATFFFVK